MLGQLHVSPARCLCLLLERMENDHHLLQIRRVDHPKCPRVIPESNLFDSLADRWHRLEVVGLQPTLQLIELVSRIVSHILWKVTPTLQGVAQKADRLRLIYPFGYTSARALCTLLAARRELDKNEAQSVISATRFSKRSPRR